MTATIQHLESFPGFLNRTIALNAMYNADDPLHEAMLSDEPNDAAREARSALLAIHKNFPQDAPLADQGAYLLRAFALRVPFGAANFRTGWEYVGELMQHHNHVVDAPLDQQQRMATALWEMLQDHQPALEDRDEAFDLARGWLKQHIS